MKLPMAHYGKVGKKVVDWRKIKDLDTDDDEIETPRHVKMLLGFDPRKQKPSRKPK